MNENTYLYILCRQDLGSMKNCAGLAAAQCCHAANQCVATAMNDHWQVVQGWQLQTDLGFGTTITLAVTERDLRETVHVAQELGFHAGITHDPTYPLRDGDVTHLIPLDTCGFVIGDKTALQPILGDLKLMG